jgi:hypothetical protein
MFKYNQNLGVYGLTLVTDRIVRKEASSFRIERFNFIRKLVNHLIAYPDPMVVPVYKFEILGSPSSRNSPWNAFSYAYEMMRLPMLSRDEKSLINKMISHRYILDQDDFHPDLKKGQREFPKLFKFMKRVIDDENYTDLHDGNFLKDEDGNYRIIDLEGFYKYPGVGNRDYCA